MTRMYLEPESLLKSKSLQPKKDSPEKNFPKKNSKLSHLFPALGKRTLIFGILNCTPDSFSDGGKYLDTKMARKHLRQMIQSGVDAIDIGAESSRPGSKPVSPREQWQRLEPILAILQEEVFPLTQRKVILSLDTRSAEIASRVLGSSNYGVEVINDISGGLYHDGEILDVIAEKKAVYILMHMRGNPETMKNLCNYSADLIDTMKREIQDRLEAAQNKGVDHNQIILDPGLGFAKNQRQSWEILQRLEEFHSFDLPLLIGPSRKSFLRLGNETITYTEEVLDQLTTVALTWGVLKGAEMVRIHNVACLRPGIQLLDHLVVGDPPA